MKKYLLSLLVCVFGFIGFSSAGSYHHVFNYAGGSIGNGNSFMALNYPSKGVPSVVNLECVVTNLDTRIFNNCSSLRYYFHYVNQYFLDANNGKITIGTWDFYSGAVLSLSSDFSSNSNFRLGSYIQFYIESCGYNDVPSFSLDCTFSGDDVVDTVCPSCPSQYTSMECQTEYSLMPISSCDSEFCQLNNLCSSNTSGDVTGDGNWSALYINNIQFPGVPMIDINIPDYITWDYTGTDSGFNLYVGSGYDVDYINSIIDINSYRPNSEDFTNIFVSGLTLVFPYIIFVLFLVFMRKLIKRIFK